MTPEQLDEIERLADVEHGRGLDFGYGNPRNDGVSNTNRVRCVRSLDNPPDSH